MFLPTPVLPAFGDVPDDSCTATWCHARTACNMSGCPPNALGMQGIHIAAGCFYEFLRTLRPSPAKMAEQRQGACKQIMTQVASTSSPQATSYISPGRIRERPPDTTVFGYAGTPDVPTLNRDVFKWVQSLDLSHALKNVRRDVANGFLIAEIFSRYFQADIKMHGFANATSSHYKRDNWLQLQRFCTKQNIPMPPDLVEGTASGVHGAAEALLEHLYEVFTGKKVQRATGSLEGITTGTVPAAGGSGGAGDGAGKGISSTLRTGAAIEFGQVTTTAVTMDAAALRRRLAGGV